MYTPEKVTTLLPNQIFVFGSNYAGRHGRGAAKVAVNKFGARYGQGTGLMGQSYGIATKGRKLEILSLLQIQVQVEKFLRFAKEHPELEFLVTRIGCGLAGYKDKEIAPFFRGYTPNVILPESFSKLLT